MAEQPRYPVSDTDQDLGSADEPTRAEKSWGSVVAVVLGVGVVALVVMLHLTGVIRSGGH